MVKGSNWSFLKAAQDFVHHLHFVTVYHHFCDASVTTSAVLLILFEQTCIRSVYLNHVRGADRSPEVRKRR